MSVVIKGMKLPNSCAKCDFCYVYDDARGIGVDTYCSCELLHNEIGQIDTVKFERAECCPLVELPNSHGRLIDGDYLYAKFKSNSCKDELVYKLIKEEPTVLSSEKY